MSRKTVTVSIPKALLVPLLTAAIGAAGGIAGGDKVRVSVGTPAMASEVAALQAKVDGFERKMTEHLEGVEKAMGPKGEMGRRFNWLVEATLANCQQTGADCPDASGLLKAR